MHEHGRGATAVRGPGANIKHRLEVVEMSCHMIPAAYTRHAESIQVQDTIFRKALRKHAGLQHRGTIEAQISDTAAEKRLFRPSQSTGL